MFFHLFKARLKIYLDSKSTLFWLVVWPIILTLLFSVTLGNIDKNVKIEKIKVFTISGRPIETFEFEITQFFSGLFTFVSEKEEAEVIFDMSGDNLVLNVKQNGIKENVAKIFADMYLQNKAANGGKSILLSGSEVYKEYIQPKDINNSDRSVVYFYALLAMASIMGTTNAVDVIVNLQANQSKHAARFSVAPVKKMTGFAAYMSQALLFQFLSVMLTFVVMKYLCNVPFGNETLRIMIICFVGCFTGLMLGAVIAIATKMNVNKKIGLAIASTLFLSFLSGMMNDSVKFLVQDNLPWLAKINPANHISDGLFALYYYDGYERYNENLIMLALIGVICFIITVITLRRQSYESI